MAGSFAYAPAILTRTVREYLYRAAPHRRRTARINLSLPSLPPFLAWLTDPRHLCHHHLASPESPAVLAAPGVVVAPAVALAIGFRAKRTAPGAVCRSLALPAELCRLRTSLLSHDDTVLRSVPKGRTAMGG